MPRKRGEPIYLPQDVLLRLKAWMAENDRHDLQQVVRERLLVGIADPGREGNAEVEVAKRGAAHVVFNHLSRGFQRWMLEQQRELQRLTDDPDHYKADQTGATDEG